MKWKDLDVAIDFLDVRDQIVIQCPVHIDVPYIKRSIILRLGEPDRIVGNDLFYGKKVIRIIPVLYVEESRLMAYREDCLFYVGWASGEDKQGLIDRGIVPDNSPRWLHIWEQCGMSFADMLNALVIDGYSEVDACGYLNKYMREPCRNGSFLQWRQEPRKGTRLSGS
jgi:hypothetical protein